VGFRVRREGLGCRLLRERASSPSGKVCIKNPLARMRAADHQKQNVSTTLISQLGKEGRGTIGPGERGECGTVSEAGKKGVLVGGGLGLIRLLMRGLGYPPWRPGGGQGLGVSGAWKGKAHKPLINF